MEIIDRFSGLVNGVLTGFDRIVFKGFIRNWSQGGALRICS